jgi:hypothetical protein
MVGTGPAVEVGPMDRQDDLAYEQGVRPWAIKADRRGVCAWSRLDEARRLARRTDG